MANYPGGQYPTGSEGTGFPQYYPEEARYQAVSQYAYQPSSPIQMSIGDRYRLVTDQRFQYGVTGGQDRRYYARQREMNMGAGAATMASIGQSTALMAAGWGAGALAGAAAGTLLGGPAGTIVGGAIGMLAPMVPMHFVDNGINNTLQRQKLMHATANDFDQYRDRLGFKGGLSYSQSTSLGASMAGEMMGGGFFSSGQQMTMNKIAISNDMISAGGPGKMSGTSQQYLKNFKDLKETTELVIKTMKTTLEGGMSVIKELQNSGFNSYAQIKQQVKQAAAVGGVTGIGTSNAMMLGAAGAQAVQGTSWNASAGASMYQSGSVQAASIARGSVSGAYAVQRAGGVAQAGATLANAQMNILMNSSFGTRMAAYAMNADGTTNSERMDKLLKGKESAHGVVMGSAARGFSMGTSRVRFPFMKEDFYNSLNDMARSNMSMQSFNLWREQRGGKIEDQAAVFSSMFAQGPRDQRVLAEWLLSSNKGYGRQQQAMRAEDMVQSASLNQPPSFWKLLGQTKAAKSATAWGEKTSEGLMNISSEMLKTTSEFGKGVRQFGSTASESVLYMMGSTDGFDRSVRGDVVRGAAILHGTADIGDMSVLSTAKQVNIDRALSYFKTAEPKASLTSVRRSARSSRAVRAAAANREMTQSQKMNNEADMILNNFSTDDIQKAMTDLSIMTANNTAGTVMNSPELAKIFGSTGLRYGFSRDAGGTAANILTALKSRNQGAREQFKKNVDDTQKQMDEISSKDPQARARFDEQKRSANSLLAQRGNLEYNDENKFRIAEIDKKYNSLDPLVRRNVESQRKLTDKELTLTGDVDTAAKMNKAINDAGANIQKALTSKDVLFQKGGAGLIKDTQKLGKQMGLDLTKGGDDYRTFAKNIGDTLKKMEEDPGFKATSKLERRTVDFISKHEKQAKYIAGESEFVEATKAVAARISKVKEFTSKVGDSGQKLSVGAQKALDSVATSTGSVDYGKLFKSFDDSDKTILQQNTAAPQVSSGKDIVNAVFQETAQTLQKSSSERKSELTKQFNTLIEEQKKLADSNFFPFKEAAVEKNKQKIELVKNQLEAEKLANETNETAGGRSVGTAMAPPVLNYWNNRW